MGSTGEPHKQQANFTIDKLCSASACREWLLDGSHESEANPGNIFEFPVAGHAPLGLSLYTPANYEEMLRRSPYSSRHVVEGLLRELRLRATRVTQRVVPWLNWQLPHSLFDSADVTEIMYFLGRHLQLSDSADQYYCVTFNCDDLNTSRLALFKGLGFNNLVINIDNPTQLRTTMLQDMLQLCGEFHFQSQGLKLTSPILELLGKLRECKSSGSGLPETIELQCFDQDSENSEKFKQLFRGIRNLGYRVLGNDCFVSANSNLAQAQLRKHLRLTSHGYNSQNVSDVLGLGPGNVSNWGSLRHRNPNRISDYLSAPFDDQRTPPFQYCSVKPILDQLLCYHELDLKYFRDRYQQDLWPLIDRVWAPLQTDEMPLYHIQSDRLSLTSAGVLELSELCSSLASGLGASIPALPAPPSVAE